MRIVGLLLLCTSVSACLFDASQPSGIVVRCDDDRDCRSPQVCGDGICVDPDVVAPGQIVDLAVELAATTDASLMLVFTAPGDDGNGAGDGPRRYRVTLTPQLAGGVAREVDVVATAGAREREKIVVDGLLRGTVYSIVVEATDDAGLSTTSAPLLAETGGALCTPDPVTGALTARGTELTITRPEHLVRLYGCEVIEGSLQIVDEDCDITQLAALRNLREVTIALEISGNELCGRGLVDLSDLAALESVEQLAVTNTGTLADLSLNAAVNSITISANRALTHVNLPKPAYAAGVGIDVLGNPALTTLVAGVAGELVRVVGNPLLQTVTLRHFSKGDVDIGDNPALNDVELDTWATGNLFFVNNESIASLTLPSLQRSPVILLIDLAGLTSFIIPALTEVDTLDIGGAELFSSVEAGALSKVRSFTLSNTALVALPPFDVDELTLVDNPLLADVSAVRLTASTGRGGVLVRARSNASLDPCAVLALAGAAALHLGELDVDLPSEACPLSTPLPDCGTTAFFGVLPGEGCDTGVSVLACDVIEIDDPAQLAPLVGCGRFVGDMTLRNVGSTALLANLTAVTGALRIAASPTLSSVALPSLGAVGSFEVEDVGALVDIALPALQSFSSFRVSDASSWTSLSLGDLAALDGATLDLSIEDTPFSDATAFSGLTVLRSLRLRNTGINTLASLASLQNVSNVDVDDDDIAACDVFAFAAHTRTGGENVTVPLVDDNGNGVVDVDETTCADPDRLPDCSGYSPGHSAGCGRIRDLTFFEGSPVEAIRLPNVRSINGSFEFFGSSSLLTTIEAPALTTLGSSLRISDQSALTTIRFPSLTTIGRDLHIERNPNLRTVDLSQLRGDVGFCRFVQNTNLCSSDIDEILINITCSSFSNSFGNDSSC